MSDEQQRSTPPCGHNRIPSEDPRVRDSSVCTEPLGHDGLHFDKRTRYEWNDVGYQTRIIDPRTTNPGPEHSDAKLALATLVGWAFETTIKPEELWKLSDRIEAGMDHRLDKPVPAKPNNYAADPGEWSCKCERRQKDCPCFMSGLHAGSQCTDYPSPCAHPLHLRQPLTVEGGDLAGWCSACGALDLGRWHAPGTPRTTTRSTAPIETAFDAKVWMQEWLGDLLADIAPSMLDEMAEELATYCNNAAAGGYEVGAGEPRSETAAPAETMNTKERGSR